MSEQFLIALINFAIKFGIQAAITLMQRLSAPGATIDDAIVALTEAEQKSAQDYLDEATLKKKIG